MHRSWLATALVFAGCTPGTVTDFPPQGEGDVDAGVGPGAPDAAFGAADARPGRPDATPGQPDAWPGQPDARPGQPDASIPDQPDAAPPPEGDLSAGIGIAKVSIFQTVEITVAANGSAVSSRNASVVTGADALFGIYVDAQSGFQSRDITATVYIDGAPYIQTERITGDTGSNPTSGGFTIRVDGSRITSNADFYVELTDAAPGSYSGSTSDARYPSAGAAELGARSTNGPLELVIVPFRYNADGSGRLPPNDADALEQYRRGFLALYPVGEVNVTMHEPVNYNSSISPGSTSSWSAWLETLTSLRAQESAGRNVYYYGVAAPASSYSSFCSGGCIAGLGYVPGSTNSQLFASVGVSFSGSVNVATSLHEVGHNMGRSHAPCGGVSSSDPSFPYSGGRIGVWGWSSVTGSMKDPSSGTDIMGYCNSQWISDYTYDAIYRRVATVNNNARWPQVGTPQRYRMGNIDEQGRVTWRTSVEFRDPLAGDARRVTFVDGVGREVIDVTGELFRFDHIDGGTLFVPEPAAARIGAGLRVRIDGVSGEVPW